MHDARRFSAPSPEPASTRILLVNAPEDVELPHWNYLAEHESAAISVTKPQIAGLVAFLIVSLAMVVAEPLAIIGGAIAGAMALYVVSMCYKTATTVKGARGLTVVTDEEARSIPDGDLPVVTILLPAFKEYRTVLQHLTEALDRLEYPKNRLDIKFLIEGSDELTLKYLRSLHLPEFYEIIVTARFGPQTKPKACNIGLARAKGEITVIYDVEDDPHPLQLRKVVSGFRRLNDAPDDGRAGSPRSSACSSTAMPTNPPCRSSCLALGTRRPAHRSVFASGHKASGSKSGDE